MACHRASHAHLLDRPRGTSNTYVVLVVSMLWPSHGQCHRYCWSGCCDRGVDSQPYLAHQQNGFPLHLPGAVGGETVQMARHSFPELVNRLRDAQHFSPFLHTTSFAIARALVSSQSSLSAWESHFGLRARGAVRGCAKWTDTSILTGHGWSRTAELSAGLVILAVRTYEACGVLRRFTAGRFKSLSRAVAVIRLGPTR